MENQSLKIQLYGNDVTETQQKKETQFSHSAYRLTKVIELNSTRSNDNQDFTESLEKDDLMEFEFDDGTIWISPSDEVPTIFQTKNRAVGDTLVIPGALDIPTENRSIFKKVYLKFVKIFKPIEVAAEVTTQIIAAKIESGIVEKEGVNHVNADFELTAFKYKSFDPSIDLNKPVLLFLHGTCSSTVGSFGELKSSETWIEMCDTYGNNIIALEHRTWTKSPLENALQVIETLPENTKLHLVSHSRGGIVGEVLCRCSHEDSYFSQIEIELLDGLKRSRDVETMTRLNRVAQKKNIIVEKFVRVACPAGGTTVLGERMDHFFNLILNLVGGGLALVGQAQNPIFLGIHSFLTATVNKRTDPKSLPGLEAMIPDSPLQKILNNHQIKIESDLSIIAGNAGFGSIKKTLATILSRLFYKLDNDFVVDTDSMYMGVVRENKIYYKFVEGSPVDHFSYFKNPSTQQHIFKALTTPAFLPVPEFKEVIRGERNRNISTMLPGGSVEPTPISGERSVVILIPGIMGSNLYEEDSEIWIDYAKMATGSLTRLNVDNPKVSAKSLVGTAYKKIVDDFSEKYDVVVFPFDWRKSLTDAGSQLSKQITKELLPKLTKDKTLQIVAHSMGGLVTRDLMMNHTTLWNKLNNRSGFRCVLLGTPWQGSYLIPEVITGIGKRIKSISRLALFQSRQEILDVFVQYPGLLQLLPTYEDSHSFEDIELWKTLQHVTDNTLWQLPYQKDLDDFLKYKNAVNNFKKWKLDKVFYIAGKSDRTVSNFVCRDQYGGILQELDTDELKVGIGTPGLFGVKKHELVFKATPLGDGSVTWEHGIPKGLSEHQVYYMETGHGELANDPNHFDAIKDILATGSTSRLKTSPPTTRAMQQDVLVEKTEVFTNDVNILAKNILGLESPPVFQTRGKEEDGPIKITVKNGHLRYSKFPLLLGHFKDDGIVSAEKVVDALLRGKLSEREAIGLYPGPIGTNLVHLKDDAHDMGAIVVGLGAVEQLTPFLLSRTIELGCLEYLLTTCKYENKQRADHVGISTLLVGSRYANLSLTNSVNAILEGIINANKKIRKMESHLPVISEIEFVELYQDRADDTFYQLHQIDSNNSFYNIKLQHPINRVDGVRSYIPLSDEKEWWRRITAVVKKDKNNEEKYLGFSASTGRAMVEVRESFSNLQIIDALLEDNKKQTNWDRELTKTVFELLIPNDFKIAFRNQQNILLILDKATASFPWELLNYDENLEFPIVVSAGMIRQLATSDDRRKIKPVNNNKALIIGDPVLDKKAGVPQLPEAAQEARIVNELLQKNNYETTPRINERFKEIFKKLYDEYKIIHIASHGVIDYGEDKKTGILLSDNIVLTAAEINQISTTPELVFINSCYMGEVNAEKEEHFRSKYKLAANIGIQFIENGVKAVVVAGWAVNDAAAKRFAEVFYEKMLEGEMFADAVKAARSACFREFPNTNTWGAYQCYGDQFYRLEKTKWKAKEDEPFILEKEVLIELEKIVDATKSSRKRKYDFRPVLKKMSRRIDESGLRNSEITELEIQAYLELEEYGTAFEKYESMFTEKNATFSFAILEKWCNSKIKFLVDLKGKLSKKRMEKEVKLVLKRIEFILELGKTAERHNIMASIQKRYFGLVANNKAKRKAIEDCADNYMWGWQLNGEVYPMTSWIILEKILNDPERMKVVNHSFEKDALKALQETYQALTEDATDSKEFWDLIRPVNLKQAELLYFMGEKQDVERKKIIAEIKDGYQRAWQQGGGSLRHKNSEIEQMEFMRDALVFIEGNKKKDKRKLDGILEAFEELIDFFEEVR